MDLRSSRQCLAAALCVSTLIKLALAIFTFGTNDVVSWVGFMHTIQEFGAGVYRLPGVYGEPFNQPPFMAHVLRLMGFIADNFHLPFPLLLRSPAMLADVGSVLLLYSLSMKGVIPYSLFGIVAMALSPVSILISGFHGNTDPVMVFFILASLYLLLIRRLWRAAGLAFGMALNIKVVPLIFVPVIAFYLNGWRTRLTFFATATLSVVVCWMPYLAQEPIAVLRNTLTYTGFGAPWGFNNLITLLGPSTINAASVVLRGAIIAFAVISPFFMKRNGTNVFIQFGVIIFVFFFLTTALGVQYFAWAVPFVLLLGIRWTLVYYLSTGTLLFLLYNYWSQGTWYYADSHLQPRWDQTSSIVAYVCWALIGLMLIRYKHAIAQSRFGRSTKYLNRC